MMALTLIDHALRHRAQNADVAVRDAAHRSAGAGRSRRAAARARRRSKTPSPTKREAASRAVDACRIGRLGGFYFFYFAYLGTFAPFFSLYLEGVGLTPFDIGVVMALPQVTRIIAPHLWSWLADRTSAPVRVVRLTGSRARSSSSASSPARSSRSSSR